MKILHINQSEIDGGAAIAVSRLHSALLKKKINSWLLVEDAVNLNKNIIISKKNFFLNNTFKENFNKVVRKIHKKKNLNLHSYSIFKSNILKKISSLEPSLINLNWICNDMISIEQVLQIDFPLVWTMHDFWPFSGAEHYPLDNRFVDGYLSSNKPKDIRFFDLDKWVWKRKLKYKNKIRNIICTSNWMIKNVKNSIIFRDANIHYVPCTINTDKWLPIDKKKARESLSIEIEKKIIIFVASNGIKDKRKNFDFILKILSENKIKANDLEIIIVGSDVKNFEFKNYKFRNFKINYNDFKSLILLYSAADLLVMPSLSEAFGQTALEAGSCCTPTIAFKNTGTEDLILHKETGYISNYNDINDFSYGINWCLENTSLNSVNIGIKARNFIINKFSSDVVSSKFIDVCKKILSEK